MTEIVIEAVKGGRGRRRGADRAWVIVKISDGDENRVVTVPRGSAFEGRPQAQRVSASIAPLVASR